jgi:hypothetical protein
MAVMVACAARASFATPSLGDTKRCRVRLVRWRAANLHNTTNPSASSSSRVRGTRDDAPHVTHTVTFQNVAARRRSRMSPPNAVVDAGHPLVSFDEHDAHEAHDGVLATGRRQMVAETVHAFEDCEKTLAEETTKPADSANPSPPQPWWVLFLNKALRDHPVYVLLSFLLVDMGSALLLLCAIVTLKIPVDGDFALAYALSKSIRAPRLAFDAIVAAKMAKVWPPLAQVRVGPILDAGERLLRVLRSGFPTRVDTASAENEKNKQSPSKSAKQFAKNARKMTDQYGLAYMAAKNVIGPVSIGAIYVALRYGVDSKSFVGVGGTAATATSAGKAAGSLALASWVSTLLFPLVVLGAGWMGPKLGRFSEWVGTRRRGGARGGVVG